MGYFRTYKFLARSSSSVLLQTLQRVKTQKTNNSVLLFSVSTNTPDLENVVSYLSSSATQSIGCLSAPIPDRENGAVCSVAYLDAKDCIPFRSTLLGKPPVQVGRWLTGNKISAASRKNSNSQLPDFSQDVSLWKDAEETQALPAELSILADAGDLGSTIYFTDDAPEGLVGALSRFPNITQLGLVASHTPFITAPFTLFHNGKQFSSGAVGVGLRNTYGANVESIIYTRLVAFSEPMKIQRVDGNLIHILDDLNPTELLLDAIAAKPNLRIGRNDLIYLGHPSSSSSPSTLPERSVRKVYQILAGGQSRGTIALEGDASLQTGDSVQFYVLRSHTNESVSSTLPLIPESINLVCTGKDEAETVTFPTESSFSADLEIVDNFTISSENGFLVSDRGNKLPFKCTVPGSIAHATLNTQTIVG